VREDEQSHIPRPRMKGITGSTPGRATSLGIALGSTSIKLVYLQDELIAWSSVVPHEGAVATVLARELASNTFEQGTRVLVTGTEARELVRTASAIEALCLERAVNGGDHSSRPRAVVSMGGEDIVLYTLDGEGRVLGSFAGNKCASGTGEFFRQQLGRMSMELDRVNAVPESDSICALASRCSVFLKSDCTHRLNKREANREEIALSLSSVMAEKVADFLKRARIGEGRVVLTGGVTANRHVIRYLKKRAPAIDFDVPPEAVFYEAYGAALLARENGTVVDDFENLLRPARIRFDSFPPLSEALERVTYFPTNREPLQPGARYVLGIDGGSTTTKVCLVNRETRRIAASHYGRTHGDPVKALKSCIESLREQIRDAIGDQPITIDMVATTGSSRETLGLFVDTRGVYNEIIAHACGTTQFEESVDTIFEIGGQDAKYVLLQNGVPIDYAMNEACSAGTGSFLEESAAGDLNIPDAALIGGLALDGDRPLKFGEHCSAFINSDIRKAISQGASRENITAGIVASVVANYLNRVVGNRTIGSTVFLQGGVARNSAVAPAFAMLLDRDVLVPPDPELMGCYGVAVLAMEKHREGLLETGQWSLERILETEIVDRGTFTCRSCDNLCPIRILEVNGHRRFFGGRCSKYSNAAISLRDAPDDSGGPINYVDERNDLLFRQYAAPQLSRVENKPLVGIPRAFSVHSLYPFFSWFFHELGIPTVLSDDVDRAGVARVESSYCFPAEIAHGAVQNVLEQGVDYVFTPHVRDLVSYEDDVHASFCPITQGFPYYIRKAFPDTDPARFLDVVVSFKYGEDRARTFFHTLAPHLKVTTAEIDRAFTEALRHQAEYGRAARALGERALQESRQEGRPAVVLLGRPYNAFTPEANMGIPRKFISRGYTIIPFDILPFEEEEIYPNMYWYYGQQDMKASALVAKEPGLYATFVSNFSCAPDSFLLHYVKWQMGTKPFLILELDAHSADAGIDTRIEAFLDIIQGYATRIDRTPQYRYENPLEVIKPDRGDLVLRNRDDGAITPIRHNNSVKLLLSNMGELGTELLAAVIRGQGINAVALPPANSRTVTIARSHCSGKECVPSHLVLGSLLQFLASDRYRKDETYLLFVPITTGPCRTGQYYVFYENLLRDLQVENVVVFTMSADNSYTEIGPDVGASMWQALVLSDYLKDVQTALRSCARDPREALQIYRREWGKLVEAAEKDFRTVYPALRKSARIFSAIPLQRDLSEIPRVLVVGEIYVRRDDFAVDELVGMLSRRGIMAKVSGVSEWIHYLDFVRDHQLRARRATRPAIIRPFCRESRALWRLRLERVWKHRVERRVQRLLAPTGLLPPGPGTMEHIMQQTGRHFVNPELNSEIAVSTGAAAAAMQNGYSGIVNISPFACLIGRVIEGIFTPWARSRNYPVLSVEVDGNQLPPSILSRLQVFGVNVARYRVKKDPSELLATPPISAGDESDGSAALAADSPAVDPYEAAVESPSASAASGATGCTDELFDWYDFPDVAVAPLRSVDRVQADATTVDPFAEEGSYSGDRRRPVQAPRRES
jgi:predicted CoA-substrate-specific enzyme activase